MAPKIAAKANLLLHGWGWVEGKFVYVPLWDPPKAFEQLYAGAVLVDAAKLVSDRTIAAKLTELGGSLVRSASSGFINTWEDGDPICPPWPPWPHFPKGWPPPPPPGDPWPIDWLVSQLAPVARNAAVGSLLVNLGKQTGIKDIIVVGGLLQRGG